MRRTDAMERPGSSRALRPAPPPPSPDGRRSTAGSRRAVGPQRAGRFGYGSRAPWLLLSPAGLVMLAFAVAPIVFLIYTSFTDYNQRSLFTGRYDTVGVRQYSTLLSDPQFWQALLRSVVFTAAMVVGSVVVGAWAGRLLTRLGYGLRTMVTIVLIFAWAMPTVASSLVWKWLFQPGYGVVNWLLTQTRLFGDMTNTDWANHPMSAYLSIWMLIVWQAVPFIALTLYAALTQMPAELHEAARLDGASERHIWWKVTVPFLRPTLMLVTLMSVIWDFNVFNQIWLVSSGGPDGATTTLGIYAYKEAFVAFHLGQGAALSVITTAILIAITAFYIRNLLRSGEDL